MATIGSWGGVVFAVSRSQIKTFDGLKWDSTVKYATHERHLKEPILELTGVEVETISFTVFLSAFLGSDPIQEIERLRTAMRRGEVNRLVIGTKAYGTDKWVITNLSSSLERYDNHGNLLAARVNVSMKSYAQR